MPDVETIKVLFNYGVPAGLLLAVGVAVYRLAIIAGSFLGPIITEMANRHVKTMETFEIVGTGLLKQQEAQTELMKRHDVLLGDHTNKIDDIHKVIVK